MIRAKGHFWLATRPQWVGEYSLAGANARIDKLGYWWAAVPKDVLKQRGIKDVRTHPQWDETWGDRRQELVFIGTGMDEARMRAALDACLIELSPTAAFDASRYRDLPDPFPRWSRANAA